MSKADKMFEELGYKKEKLFEDVVYIKRVHGVKNKIYFDLESKTCSVAEDYGYVGEFNSLEILAINQKMKELGWFNKYNATDTNNKILEKID